MEMDLIPKLSRNCSMRTFRSRCCSFTTRLASKCNLLNEKMEKQRTLQGREIIKLSIMSYSYRARRAKDADLRMFIVYAVKSGPLDDVTDLTSH
jgi:hypothetical protein